MINNGKFGDCKLSLGWCPALEFVAFCHPHYGTEKFLSVLHFSPVWDLLFYLDLLRPSWFLSACTYFWTTSLKHLLFVVLSTHLFLLAWDLLVILLNASQLGGTTHLRVKSEDNSDPDFLLLHWNKINNMKRMGNDFTGSSSSHLWISLLKEPASI